MSKSAYIDDLTHRLSNLDRQIAAARDRLGTSAPRQRLKASADLTWLVEQHKEAFDKLERLKAEGEGRWEDIKTEIEEDMEGVYLALGRWMVEH